MKWTLCYDFIWQYTYTYLRHNLNSDCSADSNTKDLNCLVHFRMKNILSNWDHNLQVWSWQYRVVQYLVDSTVDWVPSTHPMGLQRHVKFSDSSSLVTWSWHGGKACFCLNLTVSRPGQQYTLCLQSDGV